MKKIRTVLGDIKPEELGTTLPHEHLVSFPPMRTRTDPDYRLDSVENAVKEVQQYKAAGGGGIGEMTGRGYGRNIQALREISERTGVHIISTTGYIMESLFPPEVYNLTESELTHLMVTEVTEGVDGSGLRCGVIKCGTSHDTMTGAERKVIRAAAKAHLETGASISTHTTDGTMAFAQIELLQAEGVDLGNVVIGHLDRRSLQLGYIKMIASTGVYVELDNVGKTKYYPDELRAKVIKGLCESGHVDRVLLSDDNGRKSYFVSYGGGPGFASILTDFVPLMKGAGISENEIHTILIDNPRNMFAF